jgi:ribonuclease HI
MNDTPKVVIYTDGAEKKSKHKGGYAALLTHNGDWALVHGTATDTTNNRMELQATIEALKLVEGADVTLVGDSKYVLDGIERLPSWQQRNWTTVKGEPICNQDLWRELQTQMKKQAMINTVWVKGHNDHPENELVDYFARKNADTLKPSER